MGTTTEDRTEARPIRRLVRRRADRKIAGVAAGLADYVGIDPIWVRLGFVLTLFAGGLGLVAYIALWVLAPVSDEPSPAPPHDARELASRFASSTLGTIIIVIGGLLIATQIFDSRPGLFWGFALVGLGLFLFWDRNERDTEPSPPTEPRAPTATIEPSSDAPPTEPLPAGDGEPPGGGPRAATAHPPPRRPRRRRERSPLGAMTLGAVFVVLGLVWLLNTTTGLDVRLVQYLAAALVILGIGIGVGAWVGRARWLAFPALLLVPLTIVASAITLPLEGGYGDRDVVPETFDALEPAYRLAAGDLNLHLQHLPTAAPDGPLTVEASVAIGAITVFLPRGLPVDVRGRVGIGIVEFQGRGTGAFDVDASRRFGPADVPAAMTLDLRTSLGTVSVWEVEPPAQPRRGNP